MDDRDSGARALVRRCLVAVVLWTLFGALPLIARADGFIIPIPPPHTPVVPDLAVRYHRVQTRIWDQVAETSIDQVFVNDSSFELEGTYIFPLPESATISEFAMFVDGERLTGKMLNSDEARRVYDNIVKSRRDPALLEYVGRNAFQASIYPIPAHGEKRVQLEYSQVLAAEQGLVHYVYPLNTERFSSRPLEEVSVVVEIHSRIPIRAVYSPSHNISVERHDPTSALVSFEANDVRPDTDFELYYSLSSDDIGLTLLSYQEGREDGFFLLLVSPALEADVETVVAKQVTFVLDTSGSMEGKKLAQAQAAVQFVLDHLNEDDRFNIVAFSTGLRNFAVSMQPVAQREAAKWFVKGLSAGGGTNIDRALQEALSMAPGEQPHYLIFLTDGLPTSGTTDLQTIVANVARAADDNVRLFAFGVGYDVNTLLLDTISREHKGASAYVEPSEDIEEEIAAFYTKIRSPLLSDVSLEFEGVVADEIYPYPLPDLFAGSQLLVTGRYHGGTRARVSVHGVVNGEPRSYTFPPVDFANGDGQDFVPRLWATRKIGYMLAEIRLRGENRELVDSIVRLAIRYGIMTPYTSFLIDEGEDILTETGREVVAASPQYAAPGTAPASGAKAVADSQAQSSLASADRGGGDSAAAIKHVGNKTFILRHGFWTDTVYDRQVMSAEQVAFAGERYQQLLAEYPESGRYLALGDRVIVVLRGTAYQVEPGAIEAVSPLPPLSVQPSSAWEQFLRWFRSVFP